MISHSHTTHEFDYSNGQNCSSVHTALCTASRAKNEADRQDVSTASDAAKHRHDSTNNMSTRKLKSRNSRMSRDVSPSSLRKIWYWYQVPAVLGSIFCWR